MSEKFETCEDDEGRGIVTIEEEDQSIELCSHPEAPKSLDLGSLLAKFRVVEVRVYHPCLFKIRLQSLIPGARNVIFEVQAWLGGG